jgi:hypothetical protein
MKLFMILIAFCLSACGIAFAQEVVAPVPPVVPDLPVASFLEQVFAAVKDFGGLSWGLKVIAVCTLLIASMKVSVLKPLWDKLGAFKVLAAPVLALVMGVVSLSTGAVDGKITGAALMAWAMAGGGAIILHQLLDAIKELPMVGPKYDAWIDLAKGFLGGKK